MAISKSSRRVQITFNTEKEKEKVVVDFLNACMNEKNTIKEILYNYIVSNSDSKLLTVTHSQSVQSDAKLLKVSVNNSLLNNEVTQSDSQLLEVTHSEVTQSEEKLLEVSDLEKNELEELKNFM